MPKNIKEPGSRTPGVGTRQPGAADGTLTCLVCSPDTDLAGQLSSRLGPAYRFNPARSTTVLSMALSQPRPDLIFVDFTPDPLMPTKLQKAADISQTLAHAIPGIPRIALGTIEASDSALAALRAGVNDFVALSMPTPDIAATIDRALAMAAPVPHNPHAQACVALIGARPGVGTSTLAAHLADMLQPDPHAGNATEAAGGHASNVALLDLGWPIGDGLLYLGAEPGTFDFAEAARNLARLDTMLLRTALAHTGRHVAVLPLPGDLGEMANVTREDCLALVAHLRGHYDVVLVDLGGFPHPDFVAEMAGIASQTWIVTDQSVGSLVSLADLLADFDRRELDRGQMRLVVNRHDRQYGLTDTQIAEKFRVDLLGSLPDRRAALMQSSTQGKLLHRTASGDPYVRAVQTLAATLGGISGSSQRADARAASWWSALLRRSRHAGTAT